MGFVEKMKAKPARSKSKRLPKRPAPQRNDKLAEWEDEAGPSPVSAREPASEGVGPRDAMGQAARRWHHRRVWLTDGVPRCPSRTT